VSSAGVTLLSQNILPASDPATIFHRVLFGYQKVMRDAMGHDPAQTLAHLSMPIISDLTNHISPELLTAKLPDEALNRIADLLNASGNIIVRIEKRNPSHVLHCEGCTYAPHVHSLLTPQDVTCPWAIFAMALFQGITKLKVKMNPSEFTSSGSKTVIQVE
jgi:hypothetical protein